MSAHAYIQLKSKLKSAREQTNGGTHISEVSVPWFETTTLFSEGEKPTYPAQRWSQVVRLVRNSKVT